MMESGKIDPEFQIRIRISSKIYSNVSYPKAYLSQKFHEHSPTSFCVTLFNV